jgi:hypothetical protein
MKRYVYNLAVKSAEGCQQFYIDAETKDEADNLIKTGGEIYCSDVNVVDLYEPEFSHETTLDDFGEMEIVIKTRSLNNTHYDKTLLRQLVDVVWQEATESTELPSTKFADELIDRVAC